MILLFDSLMLQADCYFVGEFFRFETTTNEPRLELTAGQSRRDDSEAVDDTSNKFNKNRKVVEQGI